MAGTPGTLKVSDIAPTTLRLPPELRDVLVREAAMNGRSLSQEITYRLKASTQAARNKREHGAAVVAEEPRGAGFAGQMLSDAQRQLLSVFDALTPDRQLALLTLLKR